MKARRLAATVVTIALSVAVFSFVFSFLRNGYQVNRHGAAAAFLVPMLPVALGELAFLLFVPRIYVRAQQRGRLLVRFLWICGVHLLVLGLASGGQLIMYRRIFQVDRSLALGLAGARNDIIAVAGLSAGGLCTALAALLASRTQPPAG